jgi:hypothetical protein
VVFWQAVLGFDIGVQGGGVNVDLYIRDIERSRETERGGAGYLNINNDPSSVQTIYPSIES